jgi:hypothetical protein
MTSANNNLFVSSRHSRSLGLLVAGAVLFIVGVGGSSALFGAYTGAVAQATAAVARVAA